MTGIGMALTMDAVKLILSKTANCLDVPEGMKKSKTKCEIISRMIILFAATAITIAFIVTLAIKYIERPVTTMTETASTTDKNQITGMLAMSYCPSNWPNATKIKELNISYELAVYLIRVLEETALTQSTRDYFFKSPARNATVEDLFDTSSTNWLKTSRPAYFSAASYAVFGRQRSNQTKTLADLHTEFLDRVGKTARSLQDFYLSLANDIVASRMNVISKVIKYGRVCHDVSRNSTPTYSGQFPDGKANVEMHFNHILPTLPPAGTQFSVHVEFNIGPAIPSASSLSLAQDELLWTTTYKDFILSYDKNYYTSRYNVWLRNVERRGMVYSKCEEPAANLRPLPDNLYESCLSRCIDDAVFGSTCSAQPAYDENQIKPHCSYSRLIQLTDDSTWSNNHARCIDKCKESTKNKQLCETWEYVQMLDYVSGINPGLTTSVHHQVSVYPIDLLIVHEKHDYTIDKLLSEVGGSLGLFLGAGILSIFEVIFLCANGCVESYERRRRISMLEAMPH